MGILLNFKDTVDYLNFLTRYLITDKVIRMLMKSWHVDETSEECITFIHLLMKYLSNMIWDVVYGNLTLQCSCYTFILPN